MELVYLKTIADNQVDASKLNKETQTGIKRIDKLIARRKELYLDKNEPVPEELDDEIRSLDKWLNNEVLDYLVELEEANKNDPSAKATIESGLAIEAELDGQFSQGKTSLSLDELKASCPKSYDVIFNNYNDSEINGIETSIFRLIETEKASKTFTLSKV